MERKKKVMTKTKDTNKKVKHTKKKKDTKKNGCKKVEIKKDKYIKRNSSSTGAWEEIKIIWQQPIKNKKAKHIKINKVTKEKSCKKEGNKEGEIFEK